jgi:hypothetical protein
MANLFNKVIRVFSGRVDFSASGYDLLYSTVERLNKLFPAQPQQNEKLIRLMQQDAILSDRMPIALAIIAVRKSASQGYMFSNEFQQLCDQAAEDMANAHVQASNTMTQLMPKLPGITMTMGHGKPEALNIASSAISKILTLVAVDRSLLAEHVAVSNLCDHIGEKLKINRFEAKKLYEQI